MDKSKRKPPSAGKKTRGVGKKKQAVDFNNTAALYPRLIELLPEALLYLDLQGTVLLASKQAALIHGYRAADELIGMKAMDLVAPDGQAVVHESIQKLQETGTMALENILAKKDGTRFPVDVRLSLVRDASGLPVGVLATVRDQTQQKRAEAALEESQERYRLVSQLSVDYFFKVNIAADGAPHMSYVSENISDITGRRQNEITGFDQWASIIHPDDRGPFVSFYHKVMAEGLHESLECRSFLKSGAMRWINVSVYPTVDPGSGKVTSILGTVKDITERKLAEEKIRETQQQLEFILDVTKTGIDIIDNEFNVVYVDPGWQKVYGNPKGKKCYDYFMDQDRVCPTCGIPGALETGKNTVTEETLPRENNRIVEVHTIPFQNADGRWLVAEFNIDITERKRTEERLMASLKEKETLLKEIHHRVKNNMQIITSLLNLQSQYLGNDELARYFIEAENRIRSMALVHEKLYQSENLGHIDFSLYISELANTIMYSYSSAARTIIMNIDVLPVHLPVDQAIPAGLLITELLTNAIKHAFPTGWDSSPEVCIVLREREDGVVELSISDNGIGLPEDKGAGEAKTLGLSLVPMLAGQINGEVRLNRSRGTSYTITFQKQ